VLALYFKLIEKRKILHENITTSPASDVSSRFPYFLQAHGAHYIHGGRCPLPAHLAFAARSARICVRR